MYSPALSNATVKLLVSVRLIAYSVPLTLTITVPVAPSVTSTDIVVSTPTFASESAVSSTLDSDLGTVNDSVAYANPWSLSPG